MAGTGGAGIGTFTVFPEEAGPGAGCPGIGIVVFVGAGALLAGADLVAPSKTVDPKPALRVAMIESDRDVTMNNTAEIVVAFESKVAEPRGPKAVCEPIPPNAPARSAAFPLCSRTTIIRNTQTTTCTNNNK